MRVTEKGLVTAGWLNLILFPSREKPPARLGAEPVSEKEKCGSANAADERASVCKTDLRFITIDKVQKIAFMRQFRILLEMETDVLC